MLLRQGLSWPELAMEARQAVLEAASDFRVPGLKDCVTTLRKDVLVSLFYANIVLPDN